ncbi:MAG: carbamoyltransferase C-terminal domain-containing protein [Desulfitobacteriaceae bacterium]|nr:carbamoyltransferase C-terminal domain-containing protein [Desulfitobacteriaceae bacterium]
MVKKDVVVLGIHDGHTAGAALIRNGMVLAAISEERLTNIKNYSGIPARSIKKVFEIAKIHPTDVDIIAVVNLLRTHAPLKEKPFHVRLYERLTPYVHSHFFCDKLVDILHRFRRMDELNNILKVLDIEDREVFFIEHHLAHAACAYYQRPWDDKTLVLTLDGAGDCLSSTVNIGEGYRIKRIASSTHYDSVGNNLYSEITGYLGLKRWEHEYKVMGMAPYGKPEYCIDVMRELIRINPSKPLEFQNTSGAYLSQMQPLLRRRLADQRFDNIAAACQEYFEELIIQWIRNCIEITGVKKIACAGGSFLNVKANKLIRETDEVDEMFVYPSSDDGGTPVGAAMEAYYRFCEREGIEAQKSSIRDIYYGAEYDNDFIKFVLEKTGWINRAKYFDNIESEVGGLLSQGKIIARFSGRDEWGPRSLGNRSIMADPRDLRVIQKINFAIKQRDFWMPFAPSIIEEKQDDYLLNAKFAPYMTEAFDTKEEAGNIIAGVHPQDKTARPQIVNGWNPSYKKIIEEFNNICGVGGILNTSFNLHGSPIVGSPEIALMTLENSELDGLALGNWLITK